jgi:hypothetical protein
MIPEWFSLQASLVLELTRTQVGIRMIKRGKSRGLGLDLEVFLRAASALTYCSGLNAPYPWILYGAC